MTGIPSAASTTLVLLLFRRILHTLWQKCAKVAKGFCMSNRKQAYHQCCKQGHQTNKSNIKQCQQNSPTVETIGSQVADKWKTRDQQSRSQPTQDPRAQGCEPFQNRENLPLQIHSFCTKTCCESKKSNLTKQSSHIEHLDFFLEREGTKRNIGAHMNDPAGDQGYCLKRCQESV